MNSTIVNSDSDQFKEWESIGSEVTLEVPLSLSIPPSKIQQFLIGQEPPKGAWVENS